MYVTLFSYCYYYYFLINRRQNVSMKEMNSIEFKQLDGSEYFTHYQTVYRKC